jgi:hypothetical protein
MEYVRPDCPCMAIMPQCDVSRRVRPYNASWAILRPLTGIVESAGGWMVGCVTVCQLAGIAGNHAPRLEL